MSFNVSEWLNLIVRWVHVFSAILWVGSTYYFAWLDGQLRRLEQRQTSPERGVWMVHSGGFYTVVKQKTLAVGPEDVHWFRWEALTTLVSGLTLLAIVYYAGGLMVDATNPAVSNRMAVLIGVATLVLGWALYDALARTPLVRNEPVFAAAAFVVIVATAALLSRVFSGRATYIHVGALFGTIMAANVWMRILPPQRRMIAAAARGETFSDALASGAKQRSKHNTFLAVPTTFIMISNHFPTATYGSRYAVPVLGVMILVGWTAAWVLRKA